MLFLNNGKHMESMENTFFMLGFTHRNKYMLLSVSDKTDLLSVNEGTVV